MARGFVVRYSSRRALSADHAAYLVHGGMVVPLKTGAPAPNDSIDVRLEAPGGARFMLKCRAGQPLGGRGFMVSFEPAAEGAQAGIARLIGTPEWKGEAEKEGTAPPPPPTAQVIDLSIEVDDLLTDPTMAQPSQVDDGSENKTEMFDADNSFDNLDLDIPDQEPEEPGDDDGLALHPDIMRGFRGKSVPNAGASSRSEADRNKGPQGGTIIRKPDPGENYAVYVYKVPTVTVWMPIVAMFEKTGLLKVPYKEDASSAGDAAMLRINLPGRHLFEMWAVVEKMTGNEVLIGVDPLDEEVRKCVVYKDTIGARARMDAEAGTDLGTVSVLRITEQMPDQEAEDMPIRRKLQRMGMDEKIKLAQSGNRQERMALAQDSNKAIHHYLLKNAKITLDEIAIMSRLVSLNPDVLEKIAENPAYTQNPSVAKGLVYNPKTPVRTAIRLLDWLPRAEVMNLAKRTNVNLRLVMAAQKRLQTMKS